MPGFLRSKSLFLKISNRQIDSFADFFNAIIFSRIAYEEAISKIEKGVREGKVIGIDIAMAFNELLDHMFFVYGYDDDFYYICDTRKVRLIQYEKVVENDDVYYMKISKIEMRKRWKKFSRI